MARGDHRALTNHTANRQIQVTGVTHPSADVAAAYKEQASSSHHKIVIELASAAGGHRSGRGEGRVACEAGSSG